MKKIKDIYYLIFQGLLLKNTPKPLTVNDGAQPELTESITEYGREVPEDLL